MKIHTCAQGSDEWLALRAGKITASEADALLSPLFKRKESKAVDTYLGKKLAEKWLGTPLPNEEVFALPMEFGKILEIEARPTFKLLTDLPVTTVGLIETDDGLCACSPDGIVGGDAGLEIKSPAIQTHCKYLVAGVLPPEYAVQVHFSMFVTGFSRWYFMSYRRLMPPLLLEIKRDEAIQEAITDAVVGFAGKMQAGWKLLLDLNGGEPERPKTVDELRAKETAMAETIDITP